MIRLLWPWRVLAARAPSGYNFPVPPTLPNLRVTVLFFGRVRELTGMTQEAVEMPAGATLADLFEKYAKRFPQMAGFRSSLVASQNQEFAAWDTRLSSNDDIAFLPPVSGG
jgi:molybdopterin converting factor subunit 1